MLPEAIRSDVEVLWSYHNMGHALRPCDAGIGLGSHDLGVAIVATDLYHRGMFPHLIFTGANAPTTIERFPQGEAVAYREYAIEHGVPAEAILIDTTAANTEQNLKFSRALLDEHGIEVRSVLLMSRPYQQRRAFATCRKVWPEVDVICYSRPLSLDDYLASIGDTKKVVDMLVGDTQRIDIYAERGFAIPQEMPDKVRAAFERLVAAGYVSRLV
ncbi:YdcF family protein [Allorhizocola rhizosphaerae]|uniref:YdcF family protein n=1 Tax=Allorhizocola rhizosphaerae TaxID=1872709 RepID=UPI000E3E3094|nr:YdcF family protein [Allorhizocola rhizosphaerae]